MCPGQSQHRIKQDIRRRGLERGRVLYFSDILVIILVPAVVVQMATKGRVVAAVHSASVVANTEELVVVPISSAIGGSKRPQLQIFDGKVHVRVDLVAPHTLVLEALQVNDKVAGQPRI